MTATDILKQSFNFYGRLFNKVFWISVASALSPLLMFLSSNGDKPSLVGIFFTMIISLFFSAYMMVLIHQFSQDDNDSLGDAFRLTLNKVLPITGTSIVFGLGAIVITIPAVIVGSLLASGIANEQLQAGLVALVVAIPMFFYLYRCFFAVYFTLVDDTTAFDALKASNQLIKKNTFIFRGFTLLSFVMIFYVAAIVLIDLMVAVGPMPKALLEFSINVVVLPYFTIFIYRLFVVSKQAFDEAKVSSDSDADD